MSVQISAAEIMSGLYSRQNPAAVKGRNSFLSLLESERSEALTGFGTATAADREALAAYKTGFAEKVDGLGYNLEALAASGRLRISDGGYQSMMEDERFEKAVLGYIETAAPSGEGWMIVVDEPYACLAMPGELGQITTADMGSTASTTPADLCRQIQRILAEKLMKAFTEQGTKKQEDELEKWFDKDSGLDFWLKRAQRQQEFQELREHAEFLRRLRSGNVSTAELLLGGF